MCCFDYCSLIFNPAPVRRRISRRDAMTKKVKWAIGIGGFVAIAAAVWFVMNHCSKGAGAATPTKPQPSQQPVEPNPPAQASTSNTAMMVTGPVVNPPPPKPLHGTTQTVMTWQEFLKSPIGTKMEFDGADGGAHTVVHAKNVITGVRYGPDLPVSWVEGPTGLIFPEITPNGLRSVLRGTDGKPPLTPIPEQYREKGYDWVLVTKLEDAGYFAPAVTAHPGEIWALEDKNGIPWIPFF